MLGPVELVVAAFNDQNRAGEAFKALRELQRGDMIRIFNAAVLVKDADGNTSLHETEDVDTKRGALFGAIVGGLIGLLGGPGGAIVGAAAGAATGGIAANRMDMGFDNQFLEELEGVLKPNSSAVLALIEHEWVDRIVEELERYEGTLLRHTLKSNLADQLKQAEEEEQS